MKIVKTENWLTDELDWEKNLFSSRPSRIKRLKASA